MKLLEFMQPFDGTQPLISEAEQVRATQLLKGIVDSLLLKHVSFVSFVCPEHFEDRLPRLGLRPAQPSPDIERGGIALAHNANNVVNPYAQLYIPQPDGALGLVSYKAEWGPVKRYDLPDLSAAQQAREAACTDTEASKAYIKNNDAARELEGMLGLNDCHVGEEEIRRLGALMNEMTPYWLDNSDI